MNRTVRCLLLSLFIALISLFLGPSSAIAQVTLPPFSNACANGGPDTLTGGLPLGGTYSGPGVSAGVFNPSVTGTGVFTITYTVMISGTPKSATNTITVLAPPKSNPLIRNLSTGVVFYPDSPAANSYTCPYFCPASDIAFSYCMKVVQDTGEYGYWFNVLSPTIQVEVAQPQPGSTYSWAEGPPFNNYATFGTNSNYARGVYLRKDSIMSFKLDSLFIDGNYQSNCSGSYINIPFNSRTWGNVLTQKDANGCSTSSTYNFLGVFKPPLQFTADTVCLGQPTTFVNQTAGSEGIGYASQWQWNFGDGTSSSVQNPGTHTYAAGGTYKVTLIANTGCYQCGDTLTQNVVVKAAVAPAITTCNAEVCPGSTVQYSTAPGCTFYNWQVTNGTVVTGQGTDQVSIDWSNSQQTGSISLVTSCTGSGCPPSSITVPILTPSSVISGTTQVCYGSFYEDYYTMPEFPGAIYNWTAQSPGVIESGQGTNQVFVNWNPTFWSGNTPVGTYQLSVNVSMGALKCQNNSVLNVQISNPLNLTYQYNVCLGSDETISVPSPGGTFNWTVENGTLVSGQGTSSIVVNWNSKTTPHGLKAVATGATIGAYCADSVSIGVTVDTTVTPITAITGPLYVCPNSLVEYTALGNPSLNFTWTPVNGTVSTTSGASAFITWGADGPYSLSVSQSETSSPFCASPTYSITVNDITLNPPVIAGSSSACINNRFSYYVPPLPGASFAWSVSPPTAGSIVAGQGTDSIVIQYTTSGAATINLSTNLCPPNPAVPSSFSVTVNPSPSVPTITLAGNVCQNGLGPGATLTANTGYTTYSWSSGSASASAPISLGGEYTVTVTNSFACPTTATINVIATGSPNANISTNDLLDYCPASGINTVLNAIQPVAGTYQWYLNGVPVGTNSPTYDATAAGKYSLITTSPLGCPNTSNTEIIEDTANCNCVPISPTYCKGTGKGTGLSSGGLTATANGASFLKPYDRKNNGENKDGGNSVQSTNVVACDGIVNFTNSTANTKWWYWDFGDGSTSNAQNPTHTFTPGYYQVTYYALFTDSSWNSATMTVEDPLKVGFFPSINSCNNYQFNNTSLWTNTAAPVTWLWNFGDGSPTSNSSSPSHTYSSVGTYSVSLAGTDGSGCTLYDTTLITISPSPVARFTPPNVCAYSPDQFTDSTLLSPGMVLTNWLWTFGDGNSSTLQNPVYTYANPGNYTVTLTVTDQNGCTSSVSHTVTANAPPGAGGSVTAGGPTTFCAGLSVNLSAPPGGAAYLWSNGSSLQSITANATGTYSCTVTSASGCQQKITGLNVIVMPSPAVTITESGVLCAGQTISLEVPYTSNATYQWYNNGSAISGAIYSSTSVSTAADYSVTVTSAAGCTASSVFDISTLPPAITSVSVSGNTVICEGSSTTLSATVAGGKAPYIYSWSPSGANTPTVTVSGSPQLVVTDANGCTFSQNVSLTVNDPPGVSNFPSGCYQFCYKDTLNSEITGAATYQWLLNNAPIAGPGGTGPNMIITSDGSYKVIATSSAGCTDTAGTVSIVTIPLPTVSAGPNLNMCFASGETVTLDGSGTGTFLWTPNTSLSNNMIATPVANPGSTTNYILTVTGANGCKNSDTMQVKITCTAEVKLQIISLISKTNDVSVLKQVSAFLSKATSKKEAEVEIFSKNTFYLFYIRPLA